MISITAIDFDIAGRDITYHYQVQAGAHQAWIVSKSYEDFEDFNDELLRHYSKNQIPYLTGRVAPWNVGTRDTGVRRLARLSEFLSQVVGGSEHYEPPDYVVQVPHPDEPSRLVIVNKFVFEFLEFMTYFKFRMPTPPPPPSPRQSPRQSPRHSPLQSPRQQPATAQEVENGSGAVVNGEHGTEGDESDEEDEAMMERNDSSSKADVQQQHQDAAAANAGVAEMVSKVLLDSAHVTSQMHLCVTEFNFVASQIVYSVTVHLCGVQWNVSKRFDEIVQLRTDMATLYGEDKVPSLEDAIHIPDVKACSQEEGLVRQQEVTKLLQLTALEVDDWAPKGFVAELRMNYSSTSGGSSGPSVVVFVNKFFFDFFDLGLHVDQMSAESAVKDLERKKALLSKAKQALIEQQRQQQLKAHYVAKMVERQRRLRAMSTKECDLLCDILKDLDDDKDQLLVMEVLCLTGEIHPVEELDENFICRKLARFEAFFSHGGDGGGGGGGGEADRGRLSPIPAASVGAASNPIKQAAAAMAHLWVKPDPILGIASEQLERIAQCFFFCDTRTLVILKVAATILLDDTHLEKVLDTLEYSWEEVGSTIRQCIMQTEEPPQEALFSF